MAAYRIISYRVLREIKGEKYWSYHPSPFKFSSCIRHIVVKKGDQVLLTSIGETTSISVTVSDGSVGWSQKPHIDVGDFKLDLPRDIYDAIQIPINTRRCFSVEVPKQPAPRDLDYHFTFNP